MQTIKQELYYVLDYSELETIIQNHFNRPDYELLATQEWSNGSSKTFLLTDKPLDKWDTDRVTKFASGEGDGEYSLRALMCKLVIDGEIPAGNYLIDVSW